MDKKLSLQDKHIEHFEIRDFSLAIQIRRTHQMYPSKGASPKQWDLQWENPLRTSVIPVTKVIYKKALWCGNSNAAHQVCLAFRFQETQSDCPVQPSSKAKTFLGRLWFIECVWRRCMLSQSCRSQAVPFSWIGNCGNRSWNGDKLPILPTLDKLNKWEMKFVVLFTEI